jgi:hypothetical protein
MAFIDNITTIYFSPSWQSAKVIKFINDMGLQCNPDEIFVGDGYRVRIKKIIENVMHVCAGDEICFDIVK